MSGAKSGVAQQIKEEPRALYTHCYSHSLNLAASDAIKASKSMSNALDTTYEIVKLIKNSPKWELIFKELKEECDVVSTDSVTPGIRSLCPFKPTHYLQTRLFSRIHGLMLHMKQETRRVKLAFMESVHR